MHRRNSDGLLLPDISRAGCNAKVRSRDLLSLIEGIGVAGPSGLARDAGDLAGFSAGVFTIDTIRPVSRDPFSFGQIAVLHTLNDIYAEGANPTSACISYALESETLDTGVAREIINGATSALNQANVSLSKAHTFLSRDASVTVAAVGYKEKPLPLCAPGKTYSIVLSKPIGGAFFYNVASLLENKSLASTSESVMRKSHSALLRLIQRLCFAGTTDVTGFGLIGHLACVAQLYSYAITLNGGSIPIVAGGETCEDIAIPRCSAERNRADFSNYFTQKYVPSKLMDILLHTGETSGPIACVVEQKDVNMFLETLQRLGFENAAEVGIVSCAISGHVTIV